MPLPVEELPLLQMDASPRFTTTSLQFSPLLKFTSFSLSLSLSLAMAKDIKVGVHDGEVATKEQPPAINRGPDSEYATKDYKEPPPAPLIDAEEITRWSFYRAIIAEFIATLVFLYITVLTVIGYKSQTDPTENSNACGGVGILGVAWAFGGMIFVLVYCTAGVSDLWSLRNGFYAPFGVLHFLSQHPVRPKVRATGELLRGVCPDLLADGRSGKRGSSGQGWKARQDLSTLRQYGGGVMALILGLKVGFLGWVSRMVSETQNQATGMAPVRWDTSQLHGEDPELLARGSYLQQGITDLNSDVVSSHFTARCAWRRAAARRKWWSLVQVSFLFGHGCPPSSVGDTYGCLWVSSIYAWGHINPAVTFGLFLARKVSLVRAIMYMMAQCIGAICGCGLVKAFQNAYYVKYGGGANQLSPEYNTGAGLGAEIIGTFVLVYTVLSATDPKRNARDSHVPVLAPLPIGFAVFMVHLATIPITGTGINPARSFGAAVVYGKEKAWDEQWIFWVGPFIGAAIAACYHHYVLGAAAVKALGHFKSSTY
ncbi:hypothetical protein RHMOL_Rhmol04G0240600 [Rhododendron molle]|uniref:Uncharacterized protein n=1 Tax=Rhododendron molle TaxID=49168 RepID=A0ACC0P417_RHOML|nr:hypothetical protein RHMOL_Rhmol04G0240600 [Rhododendron molle]